MSKINIQQAKQAALSVAHRSPRLAAHYASQAGTTLDEIRRELNAPSGSSPVLPTEQIANQLDTGLPDALAGGIGDSQSGIQIDTSTPAYQFPEASSTPAPAAPRTVSGANQQRANLQAAAEANRNRHDYIANEPTIAVEGDNPAVNRHSLQQPSGNVGLNTVAQDAAAIDAGYTTVPGAELAPTGTASPAKFKKEDAGDGETFLYDNQATTREGEKIGKEQQRQNFWKTKEVEAELVGDRRYDLDKKWADQADIEESLNLDLGKLGGKDSNVNGFINTMKGVGKSLSELTWGVDKATSNMPTVQDAVRNYYGTESLGEVNNAVMLAATKVANSVNTYKEYENRIVKEGESIQKEEALNLTGSTVNEAVALLDRSIKGLLGDNPNAGGILKGSDLAPKILLQNLIDQGLFETWIDHKTGELLLLATEAMSDFYATTRVINEEVFGSTPARASTTPLPRRVVRNADGSLKRTLPTYVGDLANVRPNTEISRANTDIPLQVIAFGETLTSVKNYADADAVRLLKYAREIAGDADTFDAVEAEPIQASLDNDVDATFDKTTQLAIQKGVGSLQKTAATMLKVASDSNDGFYQSFEGDTAAGSKAEYANRTIEALSAAALDQLPRYNRYRIDPTSYRLYIDGGEFLLQGNLIARNASVGSKMTTTTRGGNAKSAERASIAFKENKPLISEGKWAEFEKWADGDITKMDADKMNDKNFIVHLWALANNLLPGSRALSDKVVMSLLTPDVVRGAQQDWLAIEPIADPEGYKKRIQENQQARAKHHYTRNNAPGNLAGDNATSLLKAEWAHGLGPDANPEQILEAQMKRADEVIQDMVGKDGKEWGNKMRAFKAASNLTDALVPVNAETGNPIYKPKVQWEHFLSVEMDMISAGRMFTGAQTGNVEVMKRGAYAATQNNSNYDDSTGFLQPDGSPRTDFVERLIGMENLPSAFRSGATEPEIRDIKRFINIVRNERAKIQQEVEAEVAAEADPARKAIGAALLKAGLHSKIKSFDDFLAKGPLLTTDYGETPWSKLQAARAVIQKMKGKQPSLAVAIEAEFDTEIANLSDLVNDVLVAGTLNAVDIWQGTVPKILVRGLGMLNLLPEGKGLFGEKLAVGQMGLKPDLSKTITIKNLFGDDIVLTAAGKVEDPSAPGKLKITGRAIVSAGADRKVLAFIDPDSEIVYAVDDQGNVDKSVELASKEDFIKLKQGDKRLINKVFPDQSIEIIATSYFDPGYGTAAGNSIGPAFGQADETNFFVVMDQLLAQKAPWLHNRPEFFQAYVFDNIRADPMTAFLMTKLSKKAMEIVMAHNKPADFVDGNFSKFKKGIADLRSRRKVNVGIGSEFTGITRTLDKLAEDYITAMNLGTEAGQKKAHGLARTLKAASDADLWRPSPSLLNGPLELLFTSQSGNVRKISISPRSHELVHYEVSGSAAANFIEGQFLNKLTAIDPKTKIKQVDLFRRLAQTRKVEALRELRKNPSIFFSAGLD